MNRDENLARPGATPPQRVLCGTTEAVYPRDGEGGTWIGINNHRLAFALLNWCDPQPVHFHKSRSRGIVIPAVVGCRSVEECDAALRAFSLAGLYPFRLLGVFPADNEIREWKWDTTRLESVRHGWKSRHWFSSSCSDEQARHLRGEVCRRAWNETDAGALSWLRRLHASHINAPSAFSICVHREAVETVSYTEIVCTLDAAHINYFPGSPCLRLFKNGKQSPTIGLTTYHRLRLGVHPSESRQTNTTSPSRSHWSD
jgi:transport and Golgi organization protein 2